MMKRTRNNLLCLLLLCSVTSAAQFKHKAPLEKVTDTKFYSIAVTPELSSYLKTDFSDLRVADVNGKWVPHIMYRPLSEKAVTTEMVHPVLSSQNGKTAVTIIIKGDSQKSIHTFTLVLKNAAVERKAILSGSDDQENWFIISEDERLQPVTENNTVTNQQEIDFPASKYAYYKLVIDNEKKDPLNVLEVRSATAGNKLHVIAGETGNEYITNPAPVLKQTHSGRFSLVTIEQQQPYQFELLTYKATGAKFFSRRAKLFSATGNDLEQLWYSAAVEEFSIDSDKPLQVRLQSPQKYKVVYMLVDNGDNPSLSFSGVTTQQANTFLITELQAGKSYELQFGDSAAIAPQYDLNKFSERIAKEQIAQVQYGTISSEVSRVMAKKVNNWWIWPAIIAVLGLLGFLTWKLTAEMKQKTE